MVHCQYMPRQPGTYVINVMWNEMQVPGSPFQVYLAQNDYDLARHEASHPPVAR